MASLIVLGIIVIVLSTFTNQGKNFWALVIPGTRSDINGEWMATVTYDWGASYSDTFTFSGDGQELHGTASYIGRKEGILEGKAKKNRLEFITKTLVFRGGDYDHPKVSEHRYRGKVLRDEIKFVMQTDGGFSGHLPINFTARRAPNTSLQTAR